MRGGDIKGHHSPALTSFVQILDGFEGVGTYDWTLETDQLVWSPELIRIYGLEEAPTAERDFTERVHPEDRTRVEAETSTYMGQGDTYAHEFRIVRPDGEIRYIHDRGKIDRTARGAITRIQGINLDITETRQAQADAEVKLRKGEDRYKLAYEAANIGLWDLDIPQDELRWSPTLHDLLGIENSRTPSIDLFFEHVHPDQQAAVRSRFREAIEARTTFDETFRVVRADGEVRTVAGKGRVVEERGDQPIRMIGVNYDITHHTHAEEQSHLLMQEVNHRSKNMLALVQAIARQTRQASPLDFLERFEARIRALASAQDTLVHDRWRGVEIDVLVRSQLAHMNELIGERIHLKGEQVAVNADAAQAIGMAIHELATNAAKHGALLNKSGRIDIKWSLERDEEAQRSLVVSWIESDGPKVRQPDRLGFGSVVIDRMMRAALSAETTTEYPPEGMRWRMRCPDGCLLEG